MAGVEAEEKCPLCGAPVWWRVSVLGTRLRLDVDPDPSGSVIVIETPDGKVRAKVLTGPEMPAQQEAFRQHRCPPTSEPSKPCRCCRRPMRPVWLFQLLRWDHHPGCDPEDWL